MENMDSEKMDKALNNSFKNLITKMLFNYQKGLKI